MISPTLPIPLVSDLPSSVRALFGVRRPQFGTISSWKRLEFGSQDFSFQMFHTVDLDSVALLSSFLQSTKMELRCHRRCCDTTLLHTWYAFLPKMFVRILEFFFSFFAMIYISVAVAVYTVYRVLTVG